MNMQIEPVVHQPGRIATPPSGVFPAPPVQSTIMMLPFGSLTWENFERLCYQLALSQGVFDHVALYGKQGQAQEGIDIFARKPDGRYVVWQAKRYATYKPSNLKTAVETFLAGRWVERTDTFVIAVQASLDSTKLQDEIERQTAILANLKITLEVLSGDALAEQIRPHQALVSAFFGRAWLEAFYGDALELDIKDSLDGIEFAKVRAQLAQVYAARFSDLDPGMVGARFETTPAQQRPLALLERFAMTDVFVRERSVEAGTKQRQSQVEHVAAQDLRPEVNAETQHSNSIDEVRRLSAADWLSDGDQLAIIGDAGAGKSTLLRTIALDLLGDQKMFSALGRRWGERLPIVLPFAKWARATKLRDGEVGLREVVAETLQPLLTANIVSLINRAVDERRIVLIIDGLDEWSAEQAARTTLQTLLTFVQTHDIPTLVSGRPHGMRQLSPLPQSWKTAELAPLSSIQQSYLANIWFRHLQPRSSAGDAVHENSVAWQAERFLKELRSEAALGELAGTPLLFVGLLFISLRNLALPHNRAQALRELVKLMIETHPEARATAAGEARSRFEYATKPEVRHLALGALAFASRRDGGDAGYSRTEAFNAIVQGLVSRGYEAKHAKPAAQELLAVNAETVGLIIQKGPDDVGFAHASLDEYLAAIHIQSWPFSDLLSFVSENAGNTRWRNVLSNLVSINVRPNEIDEIVEALETADLDVTGDFNRRQLLAELAFNPSAMSSQTALRLANKAFAIIEGFGLMSERAAMVKLAMNGLSDPILQTTVEARLSRWMPRRVEFSGSTFEAIASWPRSETQLEALVKGLGDENKSAARSAARSLALSYNENDDVLERLIDLVSPQTELNVVARAIEALVIGWPKVNLKPMIDEMAASRSPVLEAMAIWARVKLGLQTERDLERCLQLARESSDLEYFDRDIVNEALLSGWPDDDIVIDEALAAFVSRAVRDGLGRDLGMAVLLESTPGRPAVKTWLLEELAKKYPLNGMNRGNWYLLTKFADQDAEIRDAVVTAVCSDAQKHRGYEVWPVVAELGDERLRDHAIAMARSDEHRERYWSLLPLLSGWSDDTAVIDLIREVIALPDNELGMVVAHFAKLYDDKAEARTRLIRILREQPKPRADLIVQALIELGCDENDDEVVQAILPWLRSSNLLAEPLNAYDHFSAHPAVREQALMRLNEPEPPIHSLAKAFPDEPKIKEAALSVVSAAPLALRTVIAEAARISGDRHPALFSVLESYKDETGFHVGLQLSVGYHQLRHARGDLDGLVEHLSAELDRPGMDIAERRTTAFAGLVVLNEPHAVLMSKYDSGKIRLESFRHEGFSSVLGALLVEKWEMLKATLGSDFFNTVFLHDRSGWDNIARFIGPYPEVRRDFFDWCTTEKKIGAVALRTLAEYWPKSGVLLEHVLRALRQTEHYDTSTLPIKIAAAEILRDQFHTTKYVEELTNLFDGTQTADAAISLAIICPNSPSLHRPRLPTITLGSDHGDWLVAAQIASRVDPPEIFSTVVHAIAERALQPGRRSQSLITEVLVERVVRDAPARACLRASLEGGISPDAFVAGVAIFARAGHLDSGLLDKCAATLASEQAREGVPTVVYDFTRDELRPYSHILMEFLQLGGSS